MPMRAARMHGYNQPLEIDEVPVPDVGRHQVLIKVAATGMCRSDYQLLDGYFRDGLPVEFPFIPGHEVAGTIAAVGADVPAAAGIAEGDLVVVDRTGGTAPAGSATKEISNCAPTGSSSVSDPTGASPNTWSRRSTT